MEVASKASMLVSEQGGGAEAQNVPSLKHASLRSSNYGEGL